MRQWYETFFEDFGRQYDNESFTTGTAGECEFIEEEIHHDKRTQILDIGCGTGRHAIELSKRGYSVTGIDLSESMLNRAKEKAATQGVSVDFRRLDARVLPFKDEFDLAIMLCEGAFPLMETDEMNFQILSSAARAIRIGGRFILTTLNGLFPLFHSVKEFMDSNSAGGSTAYDGITFDLMTFRDINVTSFEDDSGEKKELRCNERYYVPSEMTWLLKSVGFRSVEIFGAKLGKFSRNDRLTTDDFEMLIVSQK